MSDTNSIVWKQGTAEALPFSDTVIFKSEADRIIFRNPNRIGTSGTIDSPWRSYTYGWFATSALMSYTSTNWFY